MMTVIIHSLVFVLVFGICHGSHFRGGSMSWKPIGDPSLGMIEVSYRLAWQADTDEGSHNCTHERVKTNALVEGDSGGLKVDYPGAPETVRNKIRPLSYYCTTRYEASDYPSDLSRSWVMGENKFNQSAPPNGLLEYELIYQSCCWVHTLVNYSPPKNWDFVMSVNLETRQDTGKINHSPITTGLPVQRIRQGCNRAVLRIPTYDPDGDEIRCRWVSEDECRSNCDASTVWPSRRFRLINRNGECSLLVMPNSATVGWYAIAIMIEDSSNGVVHSKVPFQFMLEITGDPTCSKPRIIGPSTGTCFILPVGETFSFNVTAQTPDNVTTIRDIASTSIVGMEKSPLRQVPGSPLQYYVTLTWTPAANQRGVSLVCFQPEDSNGLQGNQVCVDISVGEERVPVPDDFLSNPAAGRDIMTENTAFEIVFDSDISRPNRDCHIRILRTADGSEVTSVKVESTPGDGVIFYRDAILFSIPEGLLTSGVDYTLDLPDGLARGFGSCAPWSKARSWTFRTGNGSSAGYTRPPKDRFLGKPQCFGTFMQMFIPKTMVPYEDPTNMHFREPTCVGAEHNSTHFVIGTHYQYCGTNIKTIPGARKSIISNTILIAPMNVRGYDHMTRHNVTKINVICEMENDRTTFVEFGADLPAIVYNRTSLGLFNFSLRMYPNESFAAKTQYKYQDYPLQVSLDQRLYFEAKALIDSSLAYQLSLKSCEATPSPNPVDRYYYRFIEDGCAVDDTVRFHLQSRLKWRFSVQSFAFLGHFLSESIFIHCDIHVEENGSLHACPATAQGTNRRRRHADTSSLSRAFFNADGPIRIVDGSLPLVNLRDDKQVSTQTPLGSIYISAIALAACVILVAALISMTTVMRRLKIQNRRLGALVGRPAIPLQSITER
ncbi:uncharacterized protein [Diadema antillarum]|uniref:uncharacterized protein n=1 Tax=Diadema antillarum TaxID=105358 RepID=UPI003A8981B2